MNTVGQRIRKLREMRGYSQKFLAEKAGIHEVSLQYYEIGKRHPKADQLEKLSIALEVDMAFLQPAVTDTPMALLALLFDLVDQFDDIVMETKGGTVLFGIDHLEHSSENLKLSAALQAHSKLSLAEFKKWLIDYPPLVHNGKIVSRGAPDCTDE